jgi:type II secretory ATPase GspE/PulE/Tfp pilus assembly ATPase PilB-like protein
MDPNLLARLDIERDLLSSGMITAEDVAGSDEAVPDLVARLLKEKRLEEDTLLELVAQKMGVPFMDVSEYDIEPSVLTLISPDTARKHHLVPLFRFDETLSVASANPLDVAGLDAAHRESKCEIEPILSSPEAIARLIEEKYGKEDGAQETFDLLSDEALPDVGPTAARVGMEHLDLTGAPVVRIVDLLLQRAVAEDASDVHLEPAERSLRIRIRVDGRLREMPAPNWQLFPSVVSRIKVLADMDIAEKRLPQDGRFEYRGERRAADVRVSTYPTAYGESVVLRILDKARNLMMLEELGFDGDNLTRYERVAKKPYGIFLVTGPTGSGKTTTLYATLSSLKSPEKNIMTLEDPIEYRLLGIRQTQVNSKAGLTFASGLKAILRQDPDIIMVGEIRDHEALDMAIRSAMTGHLVFSTLHTNDAPSGIVRLADMGAEAFMVASTVIGIMSQRLVRRICDNCKVVYEPSAEVLEELRQEGWDHKGPYYRGRGCNTCRGMGYRGRVGIFELMVLTEEVERLVVEKSPASTIARVARTQGMIPLRQAALAKAREGITTLEEVLEVTTSTTS